MIQAYLEDRLPANECRAFESHFLRSGAARRKVEEARVVAEYFRRSNRRSRRLHLALAGGLVVMSGAAAYLALHPRPGAELAERRPGAEPETIAWRMTQTLTPGRLRDPGVPATEIRLPAGAALLQLKLEMSHDCPAGRCRAELSMNGERPIAVLPVLGHPNGLYVELPTSYLPPRADCLLEVKEADSKLESFQFSVEGISRPAAMP